MTFSDSNRIPARSHEAMDDEALVVLALTGDEAAVRVLVQRHNQRLFRIARGVVRDDGEAEDVVQETYVRAFTNLGQFRGDALLGTWLARIALNEAYGRLRRRRPTVPLDPDALVDQADGGKVVAFPLSHPRPDPEAEAGRNEIRTILQRAIDGLPAPFRLVLILRHVEGYDTDDVASLLGITPQTVKTRLFRARRLVRAELGRTLAADFSRLFPFGGHRCARMTERVVTRLRCLASREDTQPS